MDMAVFYEIIVPLMEVGDTATICISTPVHSFNFYSELTELRDEKGERVFNVIQVGMACEACQRAGRDTDCRHDTGDRPDWKPEDTYDKVKAIYGNRKTLLRREVLGQIADDESMAFRTDHLKALFGRPAAPEPHGHAGTVYVTVDPNGGASGDGTGGTGSDTAICSFFYDGANVTICGLETFPTANGTETRQLVATHLEALRAHPCFSRSRIVLVPEANLGNEAQEISEHVLTMAGLTVLAQKDNAYGVYTSPGLPQMYVFSVENLLAQNAISYHEPVITANPFLTNKTPEEARASTRAEFERQLRSFRRIHFMAKALTGTKRVSYTGKADKDNQRTNRLKDDMCMALLIGVFWSGKHRAGLIQERGYGNAFVRADGTPIAPVVRPLPQHQQQPDAAGSVQSTVLLRAPKRSAADREREDVSELESYAVQKGKRKRV